MDVRADRKRRRSSGTSDILRDTSISPPPKRRALPSAEHAQEDEDQILPSEFGEVPSTLANDMAEDPATMTVASPLQLNFIQELPSLSNVDTISLGNILGDPMIKECWFFNYLFDVDFVMCARCF